MEFPACWSQHDAFVPGRFAADTVGGHIDSKLVTIAVKYPWETVERLLKEAFGREVYFSWSDEDEVRVCISIYTDM